MDWKVRFIDFPAQFRAMEDEIMGTVHTVLSQGDLMMRQQMRDFEDDLAAFVGTSRAVGLANCTDALRMMLHAVGVGPGDEVITVSHTFVATIAAIHWNGATPVLVDVGADHLMDVDALEAAITPRTKGIIPVHLNGRMCDMARILAIAEKHGLFVLEDSAQALGGSFDGIRAGASGIGGTFSFYPAKMLGAFGDAGAVTTNDDALADKLLLLRDHGRATKNDLACWGFNSRLDNLQAALLGLKLKSLPRWIDRRREVAGLYEKALDGIDQIVRPPAPTTDGPHYDVFQNYVIEAENRDALVQHLRENAVETIVSWPKANHLQEPLGLSHFSLPNTERLCDRVVSIPLTAELEDWQVEYVADAIRSFYG